MCKAIVRIDQYDARGFSANCYIQWNKLIFHSKVSSYILFYVHKYIILKVTEFQIVNKYYLLNKGKRLGLKKI